MVKLFSVKEMLSLEKEANSAGLTYEVMMENAGRSIAEEVDLAYSHLSIKKVIALVGSGNNGGDALVALVYLAIKNWKTHAYIVRKRAKDDPLISNLLENGGQVSEAESDKNDAILKKLIKECPVMLDGVLGTGITLPLKDEITVVLNRIKNYIKESEREIHIVAVDCPSGVDCETGEASDATIPAEMTVTMAGIKTGLIRFPAAKLLGKLRIGNIGLIDNFLSYTNNQKLIIDQYFVKACLPERPMDAHKGTFGTSLIIAGSINYTGAALLAGMAAYRSGAGLVTLAVPEPIHLALAGQFPESTWILLPHEVGVISADASRVVEQNLERATAILIGPGFGMEDTTKEFLVKLFSQSRNAVSSEIGFLKSKVTTNKQESISEKPIVLDADGLKLMAKISDWQDLLPHPAVLTPHPGEMSILTGRPVAEIQASRLEIAGRYAKKWGHVVVLKGAFTIIASPDGRVGVIPISSPSLARAGTGDVLAGLIVGLRAQGVEAFASACSGAWIHANAGIFAAEQYGNTASVIASDVLHAIPHIITKVLAG